MHTRWVRAPSPAFVIALIALFVALGGTTYAATSLRPNSVGTTQLKNNAVTAPKIKNGAVTAAKINQAGLTVANATHATSADSATNATNATHAGSADSATNATSAINATHAGSADSATNATNATTATTAISPGTLASGKTLTGSFMVEAQAAGAGFWGNAYSFDFPLTGSVHATFLAPNATTAWCPGTTFAPTAAPGQLCVYAAVESNISGAQAVDPTDNAGNQASPFGFYIQIAATGAGLAYTNGTWAVTAP
jgi:hypothetical protein